MIRSASYDAATSTLEIAFHHGRTYRYASVPRFLYDGLLVARSKGSFFNRRIAGRYPFEEVR
jgi:lysyl-tRNA synthetase class 2